MKLNNILWGIFLIGIGVILGLNALDITNINLLFDGWWTLLIIIPSFIDLFDENENKIGSFVWLVIGVCLLFSCLGIISFSKIWKVAFPALMISLGLALIFKDLVNSKIKKKISKLNKEKGNKKEYYAVFSEQDVKLSGNGFGGCKLNAIFGGIKYDLTSEDFDGGVVIDATAIFGGIDIIVPNDVCVEISAFPLFGGVCDKRKTNALKDNKKIIYINATCMFGGVEIK